MATQSPPRAATERAADILEPAVPRTPAGLVVRPHLFELLERGLDGPVTVICAGPGSGKTMLAASWIRQRRPAVSVAWVGVGRGESDRTRFWGSVTDALRRSGAIADGDPLATLTPAPLGEQDDFAARLLAGLAELRRPLLLVVDDLHELGSDAAERDLERLLASAPMGLRTLLISRREPRLGLHRLRVAHGLTELRDADLGFTAAEAAELLAASGVTLAAGDAERLHARTEGWAAALRLAAVSLERHEAPSRFVAEFAGSERTVADYLLAEVLASRPPAVRRLLLRTSILDRVGGPLADVLTGGTDGTRLLHELAAEHALVEPVDAGRTSFRYHPLLADLLGLELRREEPEQIPHLHRRAAEWLAAHGDTLAAIRHAQRAGDVALAAELIGRHWVTLLLDGEEATLASLLAGLPSEVLEADAELATAVAAARLAGSRWDEADAWLARAEERLPHTPAGSRRRAETALATVELLRARRLGGVERAVERAAGLVADGAGGDGELQALALMNLGIAQGWTLQLADSERHLTRALELVRETGRPYIEIGALVGLGVAANMTQRPDEAEQRFRQAIAVADRVGWTTLPIVGVGYMTLGLILVDRGRMGEGEEWLARARPILAGSPEPAAELGLCHAEGMLALCRGHLEAALAAFEAGERLAGRLRAQHFLAAMEHQWQLRTRLRLGDAEPVRAALAEERDPGFAAAAWCSLRAHAALAAGDAEAAAAAVAPVLAGEAFVLHANHEIEALLLDAIARRRLGEPEAEFTSVERALAVAEAQGRVWIVLTVPGARELLEAHPRHRTAHAAHLALLLDHLAGAEPEPPPAPPGEELTERELAVLRFLPTNLSAPEIASELILSVHTVKTHMRKLYAKLDVHTRREAVQRGRALGLLGPVRRA